MDVHLAGVAGRLDGPAYTSLVAQLRPHVGAPVRETLQIGVSLPRK